MATMVKERKKEKKKKNKEKVPEICATEIESSNTLVGEKESNIDDFKLVEQLGIPVTLNNNLASNDDLINIKEQIVHREVETLPPVDAVTTEENKEPDIIVKEVKEEREDITEENHIPSQTPEPSVQNSFVYSKLQSEIENIKLVDSEELVENKSLSSEQVMNSDDTSNVTEETESACPSAPIFEEDTLAIEPDSSVTNKVKEVIPKSKCLPLEEAIRIFGGKEIKEMVELSEREEALVDTGPTTGPEHPLVDLLSTFRCSLNATERERTTLLNSYIEEEKFRSKLWKVDKKSIYTFELCSCGSKVEFKGSYEHAELLKELLPKAKMKLEGLMRDLQHSYCHHLHSAMLAHYQIDHLIYETVQSSKICIREALALVLKELKVTDSGHPVLCEALQRWARILAAALIDARDVRHLLFLMHHLFRQSHSVRWAVNLVNIPANDSIEMARAIALLDLLMCGARLDTAHECTEEETWEEVDTQGNSGAVADGALREQDLLALLESFPLKQIAARLALFRNMDIKSTQDHEWGDKSGGYGVLKSACGVRVLFWILQRAICMRPHYSKLAASIVEFALLLLYGMADLHLYCSSTYTKEMCTLISVEIEACLAAGFTLLSCASADLSRLPFRMIGDDTATVYCVGLISLLHEPTTKCIEGTGVDLSSSVSCATRVRTITALGVDRVEHYELASNVLEFLMQLSFQRKPACKGGCEKAAQESIQVLLAAHPYLYPKAFHMLADVLLDKPDPSSIHLLAPHLWRPTPQAVLLVLEDWMRCPDMIPRLLLLLDCTPHTGVSHETQLVIGSWLVSYQGTTDTEWAWQVLRRLRLHAVWWGVAAAVAVAAGEGGLLRDAYNVLAGEWGNCVPLICESGVTALQRLVAGGRSRDAVHCLSPVALVLTQSPESVAYTPKFAELFSSILEAGPSLVQRALGRGGQSGFSLLLKVIHTHLTHTWKATGIPCNAIAMVWLQAVCGRGTAGCTLADLIVQMSYRNVPVDAYVHGLLQEKSSEETLKTILSNASVAPWICESVLRCIHSYQQSEVWQRCVRAVAAQRTAGVRIHVDNALLAIGASITSEDLVIHKTASCVLEAKMNGPGHLLLWKLFFYLYLQSAPSDNGSNAPSPVGPLIFSGIIKSRVIAQLKKRLADTLIYHQKELSRLKTSTVIPEAKPVSIEKRESIKEDIELLVQPIISHFTGESNKVDFEFEEEEEEVVVDEPDDNKYLILYHTSSERMINTYINWLDQGDKLRAGTHMLEEIPAPALEAACKSEVLRNLPAESPDDEDTVALPILSVELPPPADTILERVVRRIEGFAAKSVGKARSRHSYLSELKSPIGDVNVRDTRSLLALLDTCLKDIDTLAKDWTKEVTHLRRLDEELWTFVCNLRVRRPLEPVRKQCPNKCRAVTLVLQADEWCISSSAEKGIEENRRSARIALRRLARPRPNVAKTTATLHSIVRQVSNPDTAVAVLQQVWKCSRGSAVEQCAPARLALQYVVDTLAESYISPAPSRCIALLHSCRASNSLSQSLVASLVAPRALAAADWARLYRAVLALELPPHAKFSLLTKFEVPRWSEVATTDQRLTAIEAIVTAAVDNGPQPDEEYHVLLELLGVHVSMLCQSGATELCTAILLVNKAVIAASIPPAFVVSLQRVAETLDTAPMNVLGNTLRDVGATWWSARESNPSAKYVPYATHITKLLSTLLFAFLNAVQQVYQHPEEVSWYSWSVLAQTWSPWVCPGGALVPADSELGPYLGQRAVRDIAALCRGAQGSEPYILSEVFEWAAQYLPLSRPTWSHHDRSMLTCLLAELSTLPWDQHCWFSNKHMATLIKLTDTKDPATLSWLISCVHSLPRGGWLRGVADTNVAPHLAAVTHLFTGLAVPQQTIDEACKLPWWRLPPAALEPALDHFFVEHYSVSEPYHRVPQFKLLLHASELSFDPSHNAVACRSDARLKRVCCVSLWSRAVCAPLLSEMVAESVKNMLDTITSVAPLLGPNDDEVIELLGRALSVLCTEPAGAKALPQWKSWLRATPLKVLESSLTAISNLTVLDYFAELADVAAMAYLQHGESSGWPEISVRWSNCLWNDIPSLFRRRALFAAYGVQLATTLLPQHVLDLLNADIDFPSNEAIVAVWVCRICRLSSQTATVATDERPDHVTGDQLLKRWAEEPKLNILRAITMTASSDVPTPKIRLLSRYAQVILNPESESCAVAFQSSAKTVLGSSPQETQSLIKNSRLAALPRLAQRVFPQHHNYFAIEVIMAE